MNRNELEQRLGDYRFYHIIPLGDGLETPGDPANLPTQKLVASQLGQLPLRGKRVLDIGCRDGLFCFQAEQMGAAEVVGIDNDLSRPAVELLIPYFRSKVRMEALNLFDLTPERFGRFDVAIFAGVLYHLRYPFWALRLVREVMQPGGTMILETAIWRGERGHAMLYCPTGAESFYEPTSCTFFNEKGLRDTLGSLGFVVEEVVFRPRLSRLVTPGSSGRVLRGKWRRLRQVAGKRLRGARLRTNIDRAVFVCALPAGRQITTEQAYWDGLHTIHSG